MDPPGNGYNNAAIRLHTPAVGVIQKTQWHNGHKVGNERTIPGRGDKFLFSEETRGCQEPRQITSSATRYTSPG
ncbi:hypothetical protein VTN49DRAFT_4429 [Thermomyces lanuginosus]|uniref:uncharacterized protein n=1 Tax=Thermomyces lanuginosus TaxID=5541 RepID=UPI003742D63E